jgi:hypothetical protein
VHDLAFLSIIHHSAPCYYYCSQPYGTQRQERCHGGRAGLGFAHACRSHEDPIQVVFHKTGGPYPASQLTRPSLAGGYKVQSRLRLYYSLDPSASTISQWNSTDSHGTLCPRGYAIYVILSRHDFLFYYPPPDSLGFLGTANATASPHYRHENSNLHISTTTG